MYLRTGFISGSFFWVDMGWVDGIYLLHDDHLGLNWRIR